MNKKITVTCKADEDVDKSAFVRCDVLENDKKIGDFNVSIDPEKGEFKMEIKGKRLIEVIKK